MLARHVPLPLLIMLVGIVLVFLGVISLAFGYVLVLIGLGLLDRWQAGRHDGEKEIAQSAGSDSSSICASAPGSKVSSGSSGCGP